MKITFTNRADFENSFGLIVNLSVRGNSAQDLNINYADMVFGFEDKYQFERAVESLKKNKVDNFIVN